LATVPQISEQGQQRIANGLIARGPGDLHHDIHQGQIAPVAAERFPHDTLRAVSVSRVSQGALAHDQSDTGGLYCISSSRQT